MSYIGKLIMENKSRIISSLSVVGLTGGTYHLFNLGKQMEFMNQTINKMEVRMDENIKEIRDNMREIRQYLFIKTSTKEN